MYRSPNLFRMIKYRILRWVGYVARVEEGRSALKVLTNKSIEKGPLGRPRRRGENNVRMNLEYIGVIARNVCIYL